MGAAESAVLPDHVQSATARVDRDVGQAAADVGARAQREAGVRIDIIDDRVVRDPDGL